VAGKAVQLGRAAASNVWIEQPEPRKA
jgi:hypothetical protein